MRALVLDDDPAIGRWVRRIATSVGFAVDTAGDRPSFRAQYETGVPDVIVLDLHVGETDGVEELRFLSGKSYRNPLILMSGFDERVLATTERLALSMGLMPVARLSKPVRAEHLTRVLDEIKDKAQPLSAVRVLEAVRRNELVLEYQPIVARDGMAVRSLEALVRWNHPGQGRVSPDRFIPLAEEASEVIDALTDWVIAAAAQEYSHLCLMGLSTPIAVNVSGRNLNDLSFPDRLHTALRQAGVPADRFCVELTESTASYDPARLMDIVSRLRLKGVEVAIDDFGTGYSSLKQLRQLPFSALKIDRSFVADVATSSDALAIVRATIDLARNMEMESIAEGVETKQTAAVLEALGVDAMQGYLFARPLSTQDLAGWLKQRL